MAMNKYNTNLAKEFAANVKAESEKAATKKVAPKARSFVKTGPSKKAALNSYARGKELVDEFKSKGYATIKTKGARVSPRKAKK